MIVKLLTEHHLAFLSLKGGCRGLSESTHIKMPHCWKSHAMSHFFYFFFLQDCMELQHKQTKAVNVTCFSFLSGDVNNFVVGSEDCSVYTACRHGR